MLRSLSRSIRPALTNRTCLMGSRFCSGETLSEGEQKLKRILEEKWPNASKIDVRDISGGCGSMYFVEVKTEDFKNVRLVEQHKLVNEVLKTEIKDMHGIRISTGTG